MKSIAKKVVSLSLVFAIVLCLFSVCSPSILDMVSAKAASDGLVCITDTSYVDYGWYGGNEGDSCLFNLDKNGLCNNANENGYYRNGNIGLDGTEFNNGFEAWIARWNYQDEISWAYASFALDSKYISLSCKTDLIQSYNTSNFDTTVYFYNGDTYITSVVLTDQNYKHSFSVDVSDVDTLTIVVKDNVAVSGGTSFALYDMFLTEADVSPESPEEVNICFYGFNDDLIRIYSELPGTEIYVNYANAPVVDNYIFTGWVSKGGTFLGKTFNTYVPDAGLDFYALYERIPVELITKEDSITVIDRNNKNVDDYNNDCEWYIYGLGTKLRDDKLIKEYIDVQGDGIIEITYSSEEYAPYVGTGSIVSVFDNVTGLLVEVFTVIIFGDINGDSAVNSYDADLVKKEVNGETSWSDEESNQFNSAKKKAADINRDGKVDDEDFQLIEQHVLGIIEIDQIKSYFSPEEPLDRIAHRGNLDNYITTIILNGNETYVSGLVVDGVEYSVEKDFISEAKVEQCKNKDVVIVVKDEKVVFISTTEDLWSTYLGVSGDDVLGYNYYNDNTFTKDSITLELNIYNSLRIIAMPLESQVEEYQKNLAAIEKLDELSIYVPYIEIYFDSLNAFNSGIQSIQIPIEKLISAGSSLKKEIVVDVNKEYFPEHYKNYADICCEMIFKKDGTINTYEDKHCVTITNFSLAPNKPESNDPSSPSTDNNSLARSAAAELKKAQGAISLRGNAELINLIGEEKLKAIEAKLLSIITMASTPEETFKDVLSDKVISKIFGVKKWFNIWNNKMEASVAVNTEYGEIVIKFTSEHPIYNFNGSNIGSFGLIEYEITGGKGKKKLPSSFSKSGTAGGFTSYDIEAFCKATYAFIENELKTAYDLAYGNDANKAVDFIFGKSVNKILSYTEYGSASGLYWEVLTVAGKEYKIECPVDIYIYNSDNELVASIENNKEVLSDENIEIEINGDTKFVRLFDDSYKIVYKANASGLMRVTVSERANLDTILRTVVINDIPLSTGIFYTQDASDKILEESSYALTANNGTVYNFDSDTVNFHKHISNNIWHNGDSSTCTEKGWKCTICTICNEWYKEFTEMLDHIDQNADGHCEKCGAVMDIHTIAISTPSTTTINYGDSIILHADITGKLPAGATIKWESSNGNFGMDVSADGTTCKITPSSSGNTTFTVSVIDANENVISSDDQEMTSKAGFFDKIIAFFKKLFGLTKTIPQIYKGIF